ncbi:MAG: acetyl-CoA carboxylase biotin carboxyl carrier protein subunit [Rikenellaceae bacterium]
MKTTEQKEKAETEIFGYKTNLTKKMRNRKPWKRQDLQEIFSIIPGTVSEIKVKIADHVTEGDQLMVYEAMKMQNIIKAPFDGTVDKIFVKEGEKLAKGAIMIYLKSDAEPVVFKEDSISSAQDLNG